MNLYSMPSFIGYVTNSLDAWVPELWSQETLAILEERMVIASVVNRDFSDSVQNFGDLVNTRRPNQYDANNKTVDDPITIQNSQATNVAVPLDQHIEVSFAIRDLEEALSMSPEELVRVYLRPAAVALARKTDRKLLTQVYRYLSNRSDFGGPTAGNNTVGQLGDLSITNVKRRMIDAGIQMDNNRAPEVPRWLFITTKTKGVMQELDLFNAADKVGDDGTALRTGSLGELLGWNVVMTQNVASVPVAAQTLQADALVSNAAKGATTLVLDVGTGVNYAVGQYITIEGDVMPYKVVNIAGDTLTINRALRVDVPASASDFFRVTTGLVNNAGGYPVLYQKGINVDGSGVPRIGQLVSFGNQTHEYGIVDVRNSGTQIHLDRPLAQAIADDQVVGYGPAGEYNFGLHPDALTMVLRPLPLTMSGAGAVSAVQNFNNLSLRTTISYDHLNQQHIATMDFLFGLQVLDANFAVPVLG